MDDRWLGGCWLLALCVNRQDRWVSVKLVSLSLGRDMATGWSYGYIAISKGGHVGVTPKEVPKELDRKRHYA